VALYDADFRLALEAAGEDLDLGVGAIAKAMEKNARLLEDTIKETASRFVGSRGINQGDDRNRAPGSMIDHYHAEVSGEGDSILAFNNTARADYFEFGTEPHEIWASGLFGRGRQTPPRGQRGQFTGGKQALSFDWSGGHFLGVMVNHPGQEGIPVMAMALEEATPAMADNILDEIEGAFSRG